MAEVLAGAIFAAASTTAVEVGATFGISAALATSVVGGGAVLLGGVALSFAASALSDPQKVAAQQFQSRQPVPPRQRSYGRVKLGGAYVQYKALGGAFFYGLYHGEGPWDAIEEWWCDDLKTNLVAGSLGGIVTSVPWRNYVGIESHLGLASQAASPVLLPSTGWDASHFLNGCVYSAVKSTAPAEAKFKKFFPKGSFPTLRVTARASKVWTHADPSQTADPATWKWTDIAAPCIRDFLTHQQWGLRVPVALINEAKFDAFGGDCAEAILAKDGTQFPRYYLGGTYQLTDDPTDVLTQMLAACDGALTLEQDGTIGITGGKAPVPTVTLTDADVISLQIEAGGSKLAAFNRLKITYVSPAHDYQQVEGQAWNDASAQADSGELLEDDFSRPWVQSFNQVRRLAKIHTAKGNPAFKITGVFKLSAAAALFEEAIRFQSDTYPMFTGLTFLVARAVANVSGGTVTLDLQSLDPAAYSFDPQTEEGTPPALPNTNATVAAPAPPANLVVTIERRAVNGTTSATFLRMTATAPARADLSLIGRYRMAGDDGYATMVQDTDDPFSLLSQVLIDGAQYEAQGAVTTYGQALVSDYVSADPDPITAVADPTAPDQPSGFVANGGAGRVMLAWTNSGSPNYAATREFRGTTATFANAIRIDTVAGGPNQAGEDTDSGLAPGPYYYWIEGLNGSGAASAPVGPMMATVT
ncbi:hypothetical protein ACFZ8E_05750 [Methylobacterium sp. HMF5984]|uniref:hypothetical protein n=1 Tax=Methylobacterium sp. HMF5984 TaxID=3367370 RepID=UPI0038555AF0